MYQSQTEILSSECVLYRYLKDGTLLTFAEVIKLWQTDESFRSLMLQDLTESDFTAYFWECPPVSRNSLQQSFEFVLIDSPILAVVQSNPRPFQAKFGEGEVVRFSNLGGDAHLVVPNPLQKEEIYTHLGKFVRGANMKQQHALLQAIGAAMTERVNHEKVWLSTAGLGVYWLHVRLDNRPKYYSYGPYRAM
ncbi:MAG: hypothetical protein AAF206_11145 [Bacteroidota bacterium]